MKFFSNTVAIAFFVMATFIEESASQGYYNQNYITSRDIGAWIVYLISSCIPLGIIIYLICCCCNPNCRPDWCGNRIMPGRVVCTPTPAATTQTQIIKV
ncbi:uncharacterized protein LOC118436755 isoform X2 [Folsomia candida]|uniref:uncharacterized protein LOC118436755 isoform X2 n=1 Tax=Folsomia candida TaxID=158441 RepID=UPI001604FFA3|nr:uncharacterized protein LOC118436755 isoform X2 [Folsomia candida]